MSVNLHLVCGQVHSENLSGYVATSFGSVCNEMGKVDIKVEFKGVSISCWYSLPNEFIILASVKCGLFLLQMSEPCQIADMLYCWSMKISLVDDAL